MLQSQIVDGDVHRLGCCRSFTEFELDSIALAANNEKEIQFGAIMGCPVIGPPAGGCLYVFERESLPQDAPTRGCPRKRVTIGKAQQTVQQAGCILEDRSSEL